MGGGRPNKMMGGNFAKMLADKLKMPPGGMKKGGGGGGGRDAASKPPIMQNNVDMAKLIEEQPFQRRVNKRKPTRKVFIEEESED